MEILHIIPAMDTSVIPLAESLQRRDKENQHNFFVTISFHAVLKKNMELLRIQNLQCMPVFGRFTSIRKMLYLYEQTKKADRVVWHTLKTNGGYTSYFLFLFRNILKKSIWIPCEGEIGNYATVHNRLLNHFARQVNHYVQRRINWIGLNYESDRALLDEFEISKPHVQILPYVMERHNQEILNRCIEFSAKIVRKKKIFVQIGASSQQGNNHIYLLKKLCNLTDLEDAVLFMPFRFIIPGVRYSGGTQGYIKKVCAEANQLRMTPICLNKQVPVEDYVDCLAAIDIVVLGNAESVQMGMLTCLLAMNKRIFMPQSSPLFQHLNSQGAEIHSLDELEAARSLKAVMELPGSRLPEELLQQYTTDNVLTLWRSWCAKTEK